MRAFFKSINFQMNLKNAANDLIKQLKEQVPAQPTINDAFDLV